jgi:hypothetical protein
MKAVLEKEHWSLLFENIDNANKEILSVGDFKSVDFNTALERLKCIVGFVFSKQRKRCQGFILNKNIENKMSRMKP